MGGSFDPVRLGQHLIRTAPVAALGTLSQQGGCPFVSYTTVATLPNGVPILLLSRLAMHTRNLLADNRASLLFVESDGDPTAAPLTRVRITLTGRLTPCTDSQQSRRRFLWRHPDAADYVDFGDFAFYRLDLEMAHLVAGFGRIVEITPSDLLLPPDLGDRLSEVEQGAIEHMNADHAEALGHYAELLARAAPGRWRAVGCDPAGIDLAADRRAVRIDFPDRVTNATELRATLVALAREARARSMPGGSND